MISFDAISCQWAIFLVFYSKAGRFGFWLFFVQKKKKSRPFWVAPIFFPKGPTLIRDQHDAPIFYTKIFAFLQQLHEKCYLFYTNLFQKSKFSQKSVLKHFSVKNTSVKNIVAKKYHPNTYTKIPWKEIGAKSSTFNHLINLLSRRLFDGDIFLGWLLCIPLQVLHPMSNSK